MIVTPSVAFPVKEISACAPVLLKSSVVLVKVPFTSENAKVKLPAVVVFPVLVVFWVTLLLPPGLGNGRKYTKAPELPAGRAITNRRTSVLVLFALVRSS